jgi:hypothetical protein
MATLTVPAGTLPPGEAAEVYARTAKGTGDGSEGHAGDIKGKPLAEETADPLGGLTIKRLKAGPVWVVCGSHVSIAVAEKDG